MIMAEPKRYNKLSNNKKRIKHERIAPAGKHIGFVKAKYHDNWSQ